MATPRRLLALACLLVLAKTFTPAAAAVLGGADIQWMPYMTCDDTDGPTRNCAKCNDYATKCLECMPGYDFNLKGECQKCIRGDCLRCKPDADTGRMRACTACFGMPDSTFPLNTTNPGYPTFLETVRSTCNKCERQINNVGCLKCNARGTPGRRCVLCNDGYWLNQQGQCQPCQGGPMCQTCSQTNGVCLTCKQDPFESYGLNRQKQCVKCADANCANCGPNAKKCKKCRSGATGFGEVGYGLMNGKCVKCTDPLCGMCAYDANKCWHCWEDDWNQVYPYMDRNGVCRKGTIPNCLHFTSTGACRECKNGFILDKGQCQQLPKCRDPNCFDCRGNTNGCNKCAQTYFWNRTTRKCHKCLLHCDVCDSPGTCKVCKKSYGLINGGIRCKSCIEQQPDEDDVPWCERCDGNTNRCTRCFPADLYVPNARGVCVLRPVITATAV